MPECQIPPHHIFFTINIPNSEVEHLHKFEQDGMLEAAELNTLVIQRVIGGTR